MTDVFEPVEHYGLTPEEYEEMEQQSLVPEEEPEFDWLALARDAYETSDDFFGSSLRKEIEKSIDLFNSRHPSGSKYHQESYKYRSKIFRPKTRSTVRSHEAAAATAYFSTTDVVACKADDQGNDMARFGAMAGEALVNARLADPKMYWFLTCMGAYQDSMVQGACISRQDWEYKEKQTPIAGEMAYMAEGDDGVFAEAQEFETKVLKDRAAVTLLPLENVRFDPAADWRNPLEASPYIIELMPMYRYEVLGRMKNPDPKTGEPAWKEISEEELGTGNKTGANDSTRSKREGNRQDSKDQTHSTSRFDIVWVHRNIVRVDDEDYTYYTLGTTKLLSDPVLLEEVCPHGRNYRMGVCNLEAHKVVPAGTVEVSSGIQQEINDIANQRLDNVKLVINRRSFVRRGAKVDVRGLTRSVPGGVTLVEDVNKDVRYDAPPEVTGSSYQEQDRLNNDFDELAGSFSGSSVATNRNLNETVGGMQMMNEGANSITEYQLKLFAETWLKPVLAQLLDMERYYESDERRLMAAGNGADPNLVLKALRQDMTIGLAVGSGATNPQKQVEKLSYGLGTIAKFMPHMMQKLNQEEVMTEVFGALGYQDGSRFFDIDGEEDPRIAQLQQMVQQLQAQMESKTHVEQIKQQGALQREQVKADLQRELKRLDQQVNYIDQQIEAEKNDIKRGELIVQRDAFDFSRKQKELEYAIAERDRMSDVLMRNRYGMAPGIDDQPGRG